MSGKILVVDDEPLIRDTLRIILSRDYTVTTACDGLDALEVLEKDGDFHVFFLDLNMPNMDGIELCKRVRASHPMACIFALTAYASDYHVELCRTVGFDDYFTKPFSAKKISKIAAEAFERVARWEELKDSEKKKPI